MSNESDTLEQINEIVNHMLMTGYVGKGTPAADKLETIATLSSRATMSAQERYDDLPSDWVTVDVVSAVRNSLIGKLASANHPLTCLNPEETFEIVDVKIENSEHHNFGKISVRGEETCWFTGGFKIYVGF